MNKFAVLFAAIALCSLLFCTTITDGAPRPRSCKQKDVLGDIYGVLETKTADVVNPESCYDIYQSGSRESGLYTVYVGTYRPVPYRVYCDMSLPGGGWTVILKRREVEGENINFTRKWTDYVRGFGEYNKEFMMGLEQLHHMTHKEDPDEADTELYVGLQNHHQVGFRTSECDIYKYAHYSKFSIGGAHTNYKLYISGFNKDSTVNGDSLSPHNKISFSTYDEDNDLHSTNCALKYRGGWWYNDCRESQLTGKWKATGEHEVSDGIIWKDWHGHNYSLKSVVMAFRRIPKSGQN